MNIVNTNCVIFSEGRALQLKATIDSFFKYCVGSEDLNIYVIYTVLDKINEKQYNILSAKYNNIVFVKKDNLKEQLLLSIGISDSFIFLSDKNIFDKDFRLTELIESSSNGKKGAGFSNPVSLFGSIYKSKFLFKYIKKLKFHDLTRLQDSLNIAKNLKKYKHILCQNKSVADTDNHLTVNNIKDSSLNSLPVSVCMITYNNELYLKDAIESVLKQSFQNFEFLIIDDGSTDSTEDIVKSYNDDRINYIYVDHLGISNARNQYVKHANGKYLLILDSDDYINETYLESLVNYSSMNPNADFFYPEYYTIVNENNEKTGSRKFDTYNNSVEILKNIYLKKSGVIPNGGSMIKTNVFNRTGLYNTKLKSIEDFHSFSKNTLKINFKLCKDLNGYNCRVLENSNSKSFEIRNPIMAKCLHDLFINNSNLLKTNDDSDKKQIYSQAINIYESLGKKYRNNFNLYFIHYLKFYKKMYKNIKKI